jgi:hypothetical protein
MEDLGRDSRTGTRSGRPRPQSVSERVSSARLIRVLIHRCRRSGCQQGPTRTSRLKQSRRDGNSNQDQRSTAYQFASTAHAIAKVLADLETDQRECDTYRRDDDRC